MRYFFDQDNDGHWYLIPAERFKEWEAFTELDPDSEESWDVPIWANRLDGGPNLVTFENPQS